MAGFFLSQALIVRVRQQRTLGAQPHGEMSSSTGGDGVMTRWVRLSVRTHSRRTWKIQSRQVHYHITRHIKDQLLGTQDGGLFISSNLTAALIKREKNIKSSLDFTNIF